jgi:hypothetical protein
MAKKTAVKEPAAGKALISAQQLADFMHLEKGHGKKLAPYCEAAQQICTAFAETELKESHVATMALLHCAVWLQTTGAKTVEQLRDVPLTVRYMIISAVEEAKA